MVVSGYLEKESILELEFPEELNGSAGRMPNPLGLKPFFSC